MPARASRPNPRPTLVQYTRYLAPEKRGPVPRRGFRITSCLGKGFPSVDTWTYDKFKPYVTQKGIAWDYRQGKGAALEGGKPFPGFAWRSTPELNINAIWLYPYMSRPEKGTSKVWWAHLVVARKYIGPLTPRRASGSAGWHERARASSALLNRKRS